MNRRSVVRYCGLLAVGGLAGCLDSAPEVVSDDEEPNGEETNNDEDETRHEGRTEIETTFEVRSVECGSGEDRAETAIEDETVIIDGVIGGENGCYSADLSAAFIDDDRLHVEVESYEDTDEELCTQCLTDVTYEARIVIDGEPPSEITVEHDESNVVSNDHRR